MGDSFWHSRRVLVTGASGMLGSEVTHQLLSKGADVSVIIRDRVHKSRLYLEDFYRKLNIAYGDITDFEFVERVIGEYEVETVFHLAAQTQVKVGNVSPLSTFNSNIKGTWNVLEAVRLHRPHVRSLVVASSDKAYGDQKILPYNEETALQGRHPYDVSKSCADLVAQSYRVSFNLPVAVTRCGNLFGPGDLNFNRIVPGTILSLMKNEPPIIRSDGQYIRNYFYTKDAANAYLEISENFEKTVGQVFNVGSEERYSVLDLVSLITEEMGSSLTPVIKNEASNEIREQYLSIDKVKRVLGWHPKYSVREALKETIAWYKKYFSVD
ncbi:MAG: GDP-mannose 4,6-dehydratase [Patescibacteria group bacterium]|nr:GDP-mannose 4,6-dehydratase [Patescibacteria group bacterium]